MRLFGINWFCKMNQNTHSFGHVASVHGSCEGAQFQSTCLASASMKTCLKTFLICVSSETQSFFPRNPAKMHSFIRGNPRRPLDNLIMRKNLVFFVGFWRDIASKMDCGWFVWTKTNKEQSFFQQNSFIYFPTTAHRTIHCMLYIWSDCHSD